MFPLQLSLYLIGPLQMGDIDIEDGFDAPAAVRQNDSETTVKLRQRLRQHVEPFHGDSFVPGKYASL